MRSTSAAANAALPASATIFSVQEIDRALAVNMRAPMVLAHALVPAMVAKGRGHLLFMSSLLGKAAAPGTAVVQRQQVRVAWVRLRAAGRSARRRRRRIGGLPRHHPRRGNVRRCRKRGRADRCRNQFARGCSRCGRHSDRAKSRRGRRSAAGDTHTLDSGRACSASSPQASWRRLGHERRDDKVADRQRYDKRWKTSGVGSGPHRFRCAEETPARQTAIGAVCRLSLATEHPVTQ